MAARRDEKHGFNMDYSLDPAGGVHITGPWIPCVADMCRHDGHRSRVPPGMGWRLSWLCTCNKPQLPSPQRPLRDFK